MKIFTEPSVEIIEVISEKIMDGTSTPDQGITSGDF